MPIYGGGRLLFNERPLKYGSELNKLNIPSAVLIQPTDYYLIVKGYKQFDVSALGLPNSISTLLSSWTIDVNTKDPQYIGNSNFKFEQKMADGSILKRNAVTVTVRKAFVHNNIRILLYGKSSPKEDPLFWIDLDEENK